MVGVEVNVGVLVGVDDFNGSGVSVTVGVFVFVGVAVGVSVGGGLKRSFSRAMVVNGLFEFSHQSWMYVSTASGLFPVISKVRASM